MNILSQKKCQLGEGEKLNCSSEAHQNVLSPNIVVKIEGDKLRFKPSNTKILTYSMME